MQFEIQTARNVAYISFLLLTTILVVYVTILLVDKVTTISKAFGQLPASSTSHSSAPISVKIIYPDKGQTMDVGSSLEISGESRYDPSYACHVSVIINDVKPYQKTTPTGDGVRDDYAMWKYTINSDYTTIREGDNRITARLICTDDVGEEVRKWYSINVIGQTGTENSPAKGEMISIPTNTESRLGMSKTTIEINSNVFKDLINDRIRNSTGAIRDTIEDSIMYIYTGAR
jgi:hypothetical protein